MGSEAVGVVLAGGLARRLGGLKPDAQLFGRTLSGWVSSALSGVVGEVVVVARADTVLTAPEGVSVWREPSLVAPPHPLAGLAFALSRSGGRDVLCCPVDLPFVSPATLSALLRAPGEVAVAAGQPLLGRFPVGCAERLAAAARSGSSARHAVAALSPVLVDVPEADLLNVNTPADLARAEAVASARPPRS